MLIDYRHDRIRTLRAPPGTRDALAMRRSYERALATVELRPRGLSARAILCVRRLRAAQPRRRDGWASALAGPVGALLAGAVRPFRDAVPADATAVFWADEAELLACLARDWTLGATDRWWWRGLFGRALSDELVADALVSGPQLVPAALELLAADGQLMNVLRALQPAVCARVAEAVAEVFGSAGWSAEALESTEEFQIERPVIDGVRRWWAGVVVTQHDIETLSTPARALCGLALAIRRAPTFARAPELRPLLCRTPSSAQRTLQAGSHAPASPNDTSSKRGAAEAPVTSRYSEDAASRVTVEDRAVAERGLAEGLAPPTTTTAIASELAAAPAEIAREGRSSAAVDATPLPLGAPGARGETIVIHSDCAGLIYLVNLALRLELYPDFTRPASPGLPMHFATFLQYVGERVCGDSFREDEMVLVLEALTPPDEPPSESRGEWIDAAFTRLAQQTALLLGEDENRALTFLIRRPGRVEVSPIRVDSYFALVTHPLVIRMSGLDRNPGWVPGLGRFVELHYE